MARQTSNRRLTAILVADVVYYSRLMGIDETGTHRVMRQLNTELVEPVVSECRGRIVKAMGDGYLVEFSTVMRSSLAD